MPPMALARLGGSDMPLEAYSWGPNDISPDGSAKTTIRPDPSLYFDEDHSLRMGTPATIKFKDEGRIRPVCPFFELHGVWQDDERVERRALDYRLVMPERIEWRIQVANLKAFNLTRDPGTAIRASVNVRGDQFGWHDLVGTCDEAAPDPLIPPGRGILLGRIRVARPTEEFPEFRLRFHPAPGHFYGPSNLKSRWNVDIPAERLFLDSRSSWCTWREDPDDLRATPQGQYAADGDGASYGLVDDVCDGIVSCEIAGEPRLQACARIAVGPPDYAPDRRPIVSIADGLKDREEREDVHAPEFSEDLRQLEKEALDLLERAFENVGLMNMDAIVELFQQKNEGVARQRRIDFDPRRFFEPESGSENAPFPITSRARRFHRRLIVLDFLRDFLARNPDFVEFGVRDPLAHNNFYTREMPALMRGAHGGPLSLTKRQYDLLQIYVRRLSEADAAAHADEPT